MKTVAHIQPIAQLGDAVLRTMAKSIQTNAIASHAQLMADMSITLETSAGVGLAAPQISESVRMIIVASRPTERYPNAPMMPPTIMINPAYTVLNETMEVDWEGCLSIPSIRALVPRHQSIGVTYLDQAGSYHEMPLQGFVARIFQHEVDHLQGMVYLDRVESNRDIISETAFLKRMA